MAVDTLSHLLTLTVTPADEHERAQVDALCRQVQQATGGTVKLAWADQGTRARRPEAMRLKGVSTCRWSSC